LVIQLLVLYSESYGIRIHLILVVTKEK
jgi:hypothetical protein